MGAIHDSIDLALVRALQATLPLDVFVEAGTCAGASARVAAPHFRKVYTIELPEPTRLQARVGLKDIPNVEVIHASSPAGLERIVQLIGDSSVVFWLDAHLCEGQSARQVRECQLLEELDAIGSLNDQSTLLIDDARFFLCPPPAVLNRSDWPRIDQVVERLRRLSKWHEVYVINDVIVFAPAVSRDHVMDYARAHSVDLGDLAKHAPTPITQSQPQRSLNQSIDSAGRSEKLFVAHLRRMGIQAVLDVGSNSGQYAKKLRANGYQGLIVSLEPLADKHRELVRSARGDPRWIVLPRMAAGSERGYALLHRALNSYSSSLLEVHVNHTKAAPGASAPTSEQVFVQLAADLVHHPLMEKIEAIKIDVQGYERHVLEGLGASLAQVRLLQVELSLVECYVGAPTLFELDALIVEELGFQRITLEPAYYDELNCVVQQYDGIYQRANKTETRPNMGVQVSSVVTSIAKTPKRLDACGTDIGPSWFERCTASWGLASDNIVSVSEVEPSLPKARWVRCESKPNLAEIICGAQQVCVGDVILTNSDILFTPEIRELLPSLHQDIFYYSHRLDVVSQGSGSFLVRGLYTSGFDVFILPQSFLRVALQDSWLLAEFIIGEPWWDYLLPVLAMHHGVPAKRLLTRKPFALHHSHPAKFSQEAWERFGLRFLNTLGKLQACGHSAAQGFLEDAHAVVCNESTLSRKLHALATFVVAELP